MSLTLVKKLKRPEHLIYSVLVLLASFLASWEYGYSVVFKSLLVLYCMYVPTLNVIMLYRLYKTDLKAASKGETIYLVASTMLFFMIYLGALSSKFQMFVLIFSSIILVSLLAFSQIRSRLKEKT